MCLRSVSFVASSFGFVVDRDGVVVCECVFDALDWFGVAVALIVELIDVVVVLVFVGGVGVHVVWGRSVVLLF